MIILKNPKTENYQNFKNFICSNQFPWYWNNTIYADGNTSNVCFYHHIFLGRPETPHKISTEESSFCKKCCEVLVEILKFNNIEINYFLRINANCTHPHSSIMSCTPHKDHSFPHKILIVYLTNAGGKTIDENGSYDPNEDDAVVFDGVEHYFETPKTERRIVLVSTFV